MADGGRSLSWVPRDHANPASGEGAVPRNRKEAQRRNQLAHSLLWGDYSTSTYPALTNALHVLSLSPTLHPLNWSVLGPISCSVALPTRMAGYLITPVLGFWT